MNFKGNYPFRIGCTSYVIPDDILPNVTFMSDTVDDIELVLFESGKWSNLPDSTVVTSMQHIADTKDITFSIHFPIDCPAGGKNPDMRERFLSVAIEIMRLTASLPVSGYLLHFEGLEDENDPEEVKRWLEAIDYFCQQFVEKSGCDPKLLCVENLGYLPRLHVGIVEKYRLSYCVDIGHLWLYRQDWRHYLNQVIDKTRIIHLHGVEGTTDHRSLEFNTQKMKLQQLMPILKKYTGVVTLEVFSEKATFSSLTTFEELWRKLP